MSRGPILVVLFDFDHDLKFFKTYPSQQILTKPRKTLRRCPYPRVLVVSSLFRQEFSEKSKSSKHCFRLCALGTVFYLLGDLQLHYYNQFNIIPYTAYKNAVRKGLFHGISLNPSDWKSYTRPEFPPTWREDYLKKKAVVIDLFSSSVQTEDFFEIVFRVDNSSIPTYYIEARTLTGQIPLYNMRDYPTIGWDTPLVLAVYKPQAVQSIANQYFSINSALFVVLAMSLIIALFARVHSTRGKSLSRALFATVSSLLTAIPVNNFRSDFKLLMTFGLWLFLSQIFLSDLKGDMIRNVSFAPRDRYHYIKSCEPAKGYALNSSYAPTNHFRQVAAHMLTYRFVCLFDLLDSKPFLSYMSNKFPKAEIYHIKHGEISHIYLQETHSFPLLGERYVFGLFKSPMRRTRVCPVRGIIYFQNLMEHGLFHAMKLKTYVAEKSEYYEYFQRDYLFKPNETYAKHTELLEEIGGSLKSQDVADYETWVKIASAGWVLTTFLLLCELAFRKQVKTQDFLSNALHSLVQKFRLSTAGSVQKASGLRHCGRQIVIFQSYDRVQTFSP